MRRASGIVTTAGGSGGVYAATVTATSVATTAAMGAAGPGVEADGENYPRRGTEEKNATAEREARVHMACSCDQVNSV